MGDDVAAPPFAAGSALVTTSGPPRAAGLALTFVLFAFPGVAAAAAAAAGPLFFRAPVFALPYPDCELEADSVPAFGLARAAGAAGAPALRVFFAPGLARPTGTAGVGEPAESGR